MGAMLLSCLCCTQNVYSQVEWIKIDSVAGSYFCLTHSNGCVFIGDSISGLLRSCDNGISWSKTYDGEYVGSACEDNNGRILIGTRDGMYASEDGGNTWNEIKAITKSGIYTHIYVDPLQNDYYVSIYNEGIFKSIDAGASWLNINGDIPSKIITMLSSARNGDLYAGDWSRGLHKSTDSRRHWEWIVKDDEYFTDLELSGNIMFVVGRIYSYKSVNAGVDWEKMSIQPEVLCKYDDRSLFALKEATKWQNTVYPAELYITNDTGRTWSLISDGGELFDVYDMNITRDGYIFVSTSEFVFRSKLPVITSIDNGDIAVASSFSSLYPNPVASGEQATITFSLQRPSEVTLRMYNVLGKEVGTQSKDRLTPGDHTIPISTQGLLPGMYFYTLFTSSGEVVTGKVVVK